MTRAPGAIRDAVVGYLSKAEHASIAEIQSAISSRLGNVSPSSIRSSLNLHTPDVFERVGRGHYRLKVPELPKLLTQSTSNEIGKARLVHADCLEWLKAVEPRSLHAIVTDPPYSPLEYSDKELAKLRNGNIGGVWRIPPSFDGHKRSPLPRFTMLDDEDRKAMRSFFTVFAKLILRATAPGANVVVAANPLLAPLVAEAMTDGGLELRGQVVRLLQTMRGGDRPKNAHMEFPGVSVMPRSQFEPWIVLRHPLDGRVQDTLRKWKTGGFRRISGDRPFGDVIRSAPTSKAERDLAKHPSLKPQAFLRSIVRAVLPLGEGLVCDPFAGSGSTLAAANAVGYASVGIERDAEYFRMAKDAIPKLAELVVSL